jgi:hypothetical protein
VYPNFPNWDARRALEGFSGCNQTRYFVVAALENIQIKSVRVKNAGGLIISFSVTPAFVASVTLTLSIESG